MNENIESEIDNFIIYFTSDEKERTSMRKVLKDFMRECYEHPDSV